MSMIESFLIGSVVQVYLKSSTESNIVAAVDAACRGRDEAACVCQFAQ